MEGLWWALPLEPEDAEGELQIPIPVLEFAAIAINIIILAPIVGQAACAILSYSLTSADVVANRARKGLVRRQALGEAVARLAPAPLAD